MDISTVTKYYGAYYKALQKVYDKANNLHVALTNGAHPAALKGKEDRATFYELFYTYYAALQDLNTLQEKVQKKEFETPAIDDDEDVSNRKACCLIVEKAKKAKEELEDFIENYIFNPTFVRCYCFVGKESLLQPLIGKLESVLSCIADAAASLDDIYLSLKSGADEAECQRVVDGMEAVWNKAKEEYDPLFVDYNAIKESNIEAVEEEKEDMFEEAQGLIETYDPSYHSQCHKDSATIKFYNDPFSYTSKTTVQENAQYREESVFIGTSMHDFGKTVQPGNSSDGIAFDRWQNGFVDTTTILESPTEVLGNWKIKPRLVIVNSDFDGYSEVSLGSAEYDMFEDIGEILSAKVIEDLSKYDYTYVIESTPKNTVISPDNRTFIYSVYRLTHTVRLLVNNTEMFSTVVLDKSDYSLPSQFVEYTMAMKDGMFKGVGIVIRPNEGTTLDSLNNITADVDLEFTTKLLYSVNYLDYNHNIVKTYGDLEEGSTFNVDEHKPSEDWPSEYFFDSNGKYYELKEGDEYDFKGQTLQITCGYNVNPRYNTPGKDLALSCEMSCILETDPSIVTQIRSGKWKYSSNAEGLGLDGLHLVESFGVPVSSIVPTSSKDTMKTNFQNFKAAFDQVYALTDKEYLNYTWEMATKNKTVKTMSLPDFEPKATIYAAGYTERYLYSFDSAGEEKIKIVYNLPYGVDAKIDTGLLGWPQDYLPEVGKVEERNEISSIVVKVENEHNDGDCEHTAFFIELPYVHFIYGKNALFSGLEMSAIQFNPRERGNFSDIAPTPAAQVGYHGKWNPDLSCDKKELSARDFFNDVAFYYDYTKDRTITFVFDFGQTISDETKNEIKAEYGNPENNVITVDTYFDGYDYERAKAQYIKTFPGINYFIVPNELPEVYADTDLTATVVYTIEEAGTYTEMERELHRVASYKFYEDANLTKEIPGTEIIYHEEAIRFVTYKYVDDQPVPIDWTDWEEIPGPHPDFPPYPSDGGPVLWDKFWTTDGISRYAENTPISFQEFPPLEEAHAPTYKFYLDVDMS